jgi:hypothetical protein
MREAERESMEMGSRDKVVLFCFWPFFTIFTFETLELLFLHILIPTNSIFFHCSDQKVYIKCLIEDGRWWWIKFIVVGYRLTKMHSLGCYKNFIFIKLFK